MIDLCSSLVLNMPQIIINSKEERFSEIGVYPLNRKIEIFEVLRWILRSDALSLKVSTVIIC